MTYEEVLETYDEIGLPGVELGFCGSSEYRPEAISRAYSFDMLCHNYFMKVSDPFVLNLASQDEEILARSRAYVRRAFQVCDSIDVPLYTVHAGFRTDTGIDMMFDGDPAPYTDAWSTFVESVDLLATEAAEYGISLGVENNVLAPTNLRDGENPYLLCCDIEECSRLFDDVDADNVGLLLDTGHLNVSARTLGFNRGGFVRSLREDIVGVHLHGNDGTADQHRPPEAGGWAIESYEMIGYDRPVVVEAKYRNSDHLLRALKGPLSGII